ncbi:Response regulator PleD [Amantichitinum ursilacus]|uniref:diguanylate cyclase n=2 Tax=Amantichitinum ursilacus TaxID=857265 RepID=A0A0N1JSS4_9NEIS|nr:Response regulator PleD [Amantichitinum ursilacus]
MPSPELLLELAWLTRQDEADQVEALLARLEPLVGIEAVARVLLIRAELAWLAARLDEALELIQQADAGFAAVANPAGRGDVALLRSRVVHDQGLPDERQIALDQALACYQQAGDLYRQTACRVWLAVDKAFLSEPAALALASSDVHQHFAEDPALNGLLYYARGLFQFIEGEYQACRPAFDEGARLLLDAGLVRQVLPCLANAGGAMGNLGDTGAQTLYVEQALTLARPRRWPLNMGAALYTLSDVYQTLGQLDQALKAAREARHWLQSLKRSRVFVIAVALLGEVCARLQLLDESRGAFEESLAAAEAGGHLDLMPRVLSGLAECLARLGEIAEALRLAHGALQVPTLIDFENRHRALLALAHIYVRHPDLPGPSEHAAPSPALHYLDLVAAQRTPDWQPDDDYLATCALAWEQVGDAVKALQFERRRIEALNRENTQRATRQIATTSARHEAENAQREAAYQRELLATERRKLAILESLGAIGQEITATPDLHAIFATLSRHAGTLLDVAGLRVWLAEGDHLVPAYSVEGSNTTPGPVIALDDPKSNSARAFRERRELLVEFGPDEQDPRHIPGTLPMHTLLFAPLTVGPRMLGVISIQSSRVHAYGEVEQLVFRNIAAYSAVALGNALNYQMLSESHQELVQTQEELERHATVDALTGLHNRRYLMWCAARNVERAARTRQPLTLLMVDLDFFKSINDSHGHAAGDLALTEAARILKTCVRPDDVVARYGGEEFVLLLPGTPLPRAAEVAERIRLAIARQSMEFEELRLRVTVSIGVADWQPGEPDLDNTLRRADQALYLAKAAGRNTVKVSAATGVE